MIRLLNDSRPTCLRYELHGFARPMCNRAMEAIEQQPEICLDCVRRERERTEAERRIARTARRDDGRR